MTSFRSVSAEDILSRVRKQLEANNNYISENSQEFKFLVIEESDNYPLDLQNVIKLARALGIPYGKIPREYSSWIPSLSNLLTSLKFTNPDNPKEYILCVRTNMTESTEVTAQESRVILRHTSNGFSSFEAFQDLTSIQLPNLNVLKENFAKDLKENHPDILNYTEKKKGDVVRGSFTRNVIEPINRVVNRLDPFTIKLIYTFFEIAIPELDCVCLDCFTVSMPNSGFGIRYELRKADHLSYEIRLSPKKLGGQAQQLQMYITNKINVNGMIRYIKWQKKDPAEHPAASYSLTEKVGDFWTHLPFGSNNQKEVFNFLSSDEAIQNFSSNSNITIPLCQCKNTI
jgi:hypothetical protein